MLIAAFEGWNDAADAASSVVDHLAEVWDAGRSPRIDPEDFYDFQVNRPTSAPTRTACGGSPGPPPSCSVARRPGSLAT